MMSYLITNAGPAFDNFAKQNISRKKKHDTSLGQHSQTGTSYSPVEKSPQLKEIPAEKTTYGKFGNNKPAARDGHTGVILDHRFIVFGGDRHHMPFNDLFFLDL